jgi:hypothetical protein
VLDSLRLLLLASLLLLLLLLLRVAVAAMAAAPLRQWRFWRTCFSSGRLRGGRVSRRRRSSRAPRQRDAAALQVAMVVMLLGVLPLTGRGSPQPSSGSSSSDAVRLDCCVLRLARCERVLMAHVFCGDDLQSVG